MRGITKNLGIILIIPILYFLLLSGFSGKGDSPVKISESGSLTDTSKFINMIMNLSRGNGPDDDKWLIQNADRYKDELGFNSVHTYPQQDPLYGEFPTPLSTVQEGNIQTLINTVQNKDLKFFYEHIFLSKLCYAQRLVYLVHKPGETNQTNNGFCFQNTSGNLSVINDTTILEVPIQPNPEYMPVCGSIYENFQHSDYFARQNDKSDWFVKPMVKLDMSNISDDTPVFRIVYFDYAGDSIGGKTILARNFKYDGVYNGDYTEKYYNITSLIPLTVSGDESLSGLNNGRTSNIESCDVDFKIYTYGQAHFWFKKLTVDDAYANGLFNHDFDNLFPSLLNVTHNQSGLYSLYMDELTYSQLPCVKYVMDKINAYNSGIKFMVSQSNWMNYNTTRKKTFEHTVMLSYLRPRALNAFAYEFYHFSDSDTSSYVPAFAFNANDIDAGIPGLWKTNNYNLYNWALQYHILGDKNTAGGPGVHPWGTFIYQISMARRNIDACSPGTLLYANPQVYGEMWKNEGIFNASSFHI